MVEFIADMSRDTASWLWHLTWKQKCYLLIILSCAAAVARVGVYIYWG